MNMKKITNLLPLLLVVFTIALSSCGVIRRDSGSTAAAVITDRAGNSVTLPARTDRIVSIGPSNTEILIAFGFGDKIVAADDYSAGIAGLKKDIPLFDMLAPDGEQIIQLEPDVIFVTGMSGFGGDDPFKPVTDAGVCVLYIPTSDSIAEIKKDIRFIADVLNAAKAGDNIISDMEREIDAVKAIGDSIADKKTVYFEISAAPWMYSFGSGVYLDEMIVILGAENILADQESWLAVADEAVLDKNPDVILTSVDYIDDPVGEIMSRPGWDVITAVKNGDVYYIDADASNRPSHNIIKALKEMAKAVYPGAY